MNDLKKLLDTMAALRDPETGCPWDTKQDFRSISPYTIEEAYEVADAIERKDYNNLKEELGDLLLQVVFHSQMAKEQSLFDFRDVMETLIEKLISRHPHVFSDAKTANEKEVSEIWAAQKKIERNANVSKESSSAKSILDDVPTSMPSLMRAHKLQKRVAQEGFDWSEMKPVLDKVYEEIEEVKVEIESGDKNKLEEELGDLLFVVSNLVRHGGFKAEDTLRKANMKFERRFRQVENLVVEQGNTLSQMSLNELDTLWDKVKQHEK